MGSFRRRCALRAAFCLLGALFPAAPSDAAEDVPGAVVLVELATRDAASVSVTYRQVRALTTEIDRLGRGRDRLDFQVSEPDFEAELLPRGHVDADTSLTLAVPVPQNLPAWHGIDGRRDETLFGDCVVIAVGGRRSVVIVNAMPTDGEELGDRSRRARVNQGLVEAFERACPAADTAGRLGAGRPVVVTAGSGVRSTVSKRDLGSLLLPDEEPRSPFDGGRHFVVGPVENTTLDACRLSSPGSGRPVFVCGSRSMVRVADGFVWPDWDGKARAVATRDSEAPFASLKLSGSDWRSLILPRNLRLADVGFCYRQEDAGRSGCLELELRQSSVDRADAEIRLSEAWTHPIEVVVRNPRLEPFDLRVRPEDPTQRRELELTHSPPALRCLDGGAAIDVGCDAIESSPGFHDYLWEWAAGARECGEVEPDYAARSSICARLSEDRRAIEVDGSSVRWLRFGLRVSTAETAGPEPAAFWSLQVAADDDGPDGDAAPAESGLPLDRRGTVEAYRLALLLGTREAASIVARPTGPRFVGYGPVTVSVSKEELRRPGGTGSLLAIRRRAESVPLEIVLTPDLTKRFAPLLEIETRDGAVMRAIGRVDRFGAEPDRVEVCRAGGDGTHDCRPGGESTTSLRASSILTVRPRGLRSHRELPLGRTALRPVIDALREPEEFERCMALQAAFAPAAADEDGTTPRGVDVYAPEGRRVALRWRDGGGRSRVSVPALSDMSSVFLSAPDAPREGLQIWGERGWRDFEERDACEAPQAPASRTAYIVLVAEDLNRTRPTAGRSARPAARGARVETGGPDDVTAFRALWSRHADELRDALRDEGFTRVHLMVVDADRRGRPRFERMAAIRSLEDDRALEFRRLHEPFHTMAGTGGTYRLDDREPLALRRAFLESESEHLDPFGTLLLLEDPHGEERMDGVFDGAVAKLRVIAGYLGPNRRFVDLVAAAVSPGGGTSK